MEYIIIMGMEFESGSEPDFGSICRVREGETGIHEYIMNASDASKLELITNASYGSTALCIDTGDIYVLMKNGWVKFGGTSPSRDISSPNIVFPSIEPTKINETITADKDIDESDITDSEELI